MNNEKITNIKKVINELNLHDRFYESLRFNSWKLFEKMKLEYDYNFFDNGVYYDIFNPDGYNEVLYLIYKDNKLYIGNEQIPNEPGRDNKNKTANIIEYWFRGDSYNYIILHEFVGVHNKSINYKGYGCNQFILTQIKTEIIQAIKPNLNVNSIGEITSDAVKDLYGRIISKYKKNARKLLKSVSVQDFSNKFIQILDDIERNIIPWSNMLFFKNRYWLISEDEQDKKEVETFLSKYGNYGDELYKIILIIFKEYLLWQSVSKIQNISSIFDKKQYISNPKCTYNELYDWKKLFDNSKPIDIIFSICYKHPEEKYIIKTKSQYKKFRASLYKYISTKNNDR